VPAAALASPKLFDRIARNAALHCEIVAWLKKDFDLGHGHAMAIYAVLKPEIDKPKIARDAAAAGSQASLGRGREEAGQVAVMIGEQLVHLKQIVGRDVGLEAGGAGVKL
jgi:uncharacterized protein DUF4287